MSTLTAKRQVSARSLAANQRNGTRSHGPRTPQGKARSAAGPLRHGYFSKSAAVALTALGEDSAEFKRRFQSLIDTYQPADPLQMALVYRLMRALWRMERFDRMAESATVNFLTAAERKTNQAKALTLMPVFYKLQRLEALVQVAVTPDVVVGAKELELFQKAQHDLPPEAAAQMLPLLLRLRAPGTEVNVSADPASKEPPAAEGHERDLVSRDLIRILAPEVEQLREIIIATPDPVEIQLERDGILAAYQPKLASSQCAEDASLRQLRDALNLLVKAKKWTKSLEETANK